MSQQSRLAPVETCACCGRRDFLVTSFSAAAMLLLTRTFGRAADLLPTLGAVHPITSAVSFAATPLPLSAVRLTGGPLKRAQELGAQNLLKLDMDRIMYRFRERAGLKPKASDSYGGWEGAGRQLTGHMAGHYLSGLSYMYAATGDTQFKDRANYMVGEYKETQDAHGDGYLGALMGGLPPGATPVDGKIDINGKSYDVYTPTNRNEKPAVDGKPLFESIALGNIYSGVRTITNPSAGGFDLNGMWSPWYVQHKLLAGLRDAYRQTGNATALDVAVKHATWIEKIIGGLAPQQLQLMLTCEFGGINESLVDIYADTGDDRWLKLSQRFHHDFIVNPLANGQDNLNGKHGNTTIPKLIGELARYIAAGNQADGDAAKNFWDAVVYHHSFATGGHGYDESFGPADKLSGMVDGTGQRSRDMRTCESCNVYNMIKMSRLLFALQPDNKFAEFHERALLNHILASMNLNDGLVSYMVSVSQGQLHEYQRNNPMTCCQGTGLESPGLHGHGLYYTSADKLWVNLYTPSTAQWKETGLAWETKVTSGDTDVATVKFTAGAPKEFTLALRRPFWAGEGFALKVNGAPVKDLPKAGAYAEIKRTWQSGDVVELTLPKALYQEALPDNAQRVALKWGPYVLAADYGVPDAAGAARAAVAAATAANSVGGAAGSATGGAVAATGSGSGRRGGRGRGGAAAAPAKYAVFVAKPGEPVGNWLKRVPTPESAAANPAGDVEVAFQATGVGGDKNDVTFKPFYQMSGKRYGVYQDLITPEEWQQRNAPAAESPAASTPA